MTQDTRISELTVGEFQDLIRRTLEEREHNMSCEAYGLQGIADLFGVSLSQAKRIKASGVISKAIAQRGRTIVINKQKALDLWAKGTTGRTF